MNIKRKNMKTGEFKKFNKTCGIAKIFHEDEIFFVAYADYMDFDFELGTIVGKGKSETEALRMALINLTKKIGEATRQMDRLENFFKKLSFIQHPLDFDDEPIVAIEGWEEKIDYENNTREIIDSGKYHNATLKVDSDGCAFAGLS